MASFREINTNEGGFLKEENAIMYEMCPSQNFLWDFPDKLRLANPITEQCWTFHSISLYWCLKSQ